MWNPYVSAKPVALLRGHNAPIFYLFISSEEGRIFSISTDKCVKVIAEYFHNYCSYFCVQILESKFEYASDLGYSRSELSTDSQAQRSHD